MPLFNNVLAGAAGSSGAADFKIERSLRFNKDDTSYLRRDVSSAGNSSVWTYSCWVKRNKLGTEQQLLRANRYGTSTSQTTDLYFDPDNTLRLYTVNSSTVHDKKTAQVFRDVSAWMHVTVTVNLPTIHFYINGVQVTDWATNTESSSATWINRADPHLIGRNLTNGSQYADFQLAEVHLVDGQALAPDGVFGEFNADTGAWDPIQFTGSHGTNGFYLDFSDNSSDAALGYDAAGSNNWTVYNLTTSGILYAGNNYNGSLNGYMPSGVAQATDPSQLASTSNRTHFFLVNQDNSINIEVVATATSMTVGSSVYDSWGANNPTTTLNNGTVTPNSSGTDSSVSGKNLATNTFTGLTVGNTYTISTKNGGAGNPHRVHYVTGATVQNQPIVDTDSLLDSPTNYDDGTNIGGNYCTLNPLDRDRNGKVTVSNGNLEATGTSNQYGFVRGTLAPASGKFYYEAITNGAGGDAYGLVEATAPDQVSGSNPDYTILVAYRNYVYLYNGFNVVIDGSAVYVGSSVSAGDVVGVAVDVDAGKLWFSHNGVWQGSGTQNPATGAGGYSPTHLKTACPLFQDGAGSQVPVGKFNFGQRDYKYTPPTNFKSFCTQNLDNPLIAIGSKHFDVLTWNGAGGTGDRTISGLALENAPDFVWSKTINYGYHHALFDSVRGFGANNALNTDDNHYEGEASGGQIKSTTSSSITWEAGGSSGVWYNESNRSYVAYAWDGGDLATNSAYNQSQNWTSLLTSSAGTISNPGNSFDGLTSTTSQLPGTSAGSYIQLGATLTGVTKLEVYQRSASDVSGTGIQTYSNCPAAQWVQLTLTSSTISNIRFEKNTNDPGIYAIRVNDKILVDKGLIPVGSLNSTAYNQDQQWSNGWTGNSGTYGRVPTNAFDGDLTTKAFPGNNNANEYVEYSFTAIPVNTSLEFYLSFDAGGSQRGQLWVNDTNVTSQLGAGNAQWYTVTGQSTLSKIKILTTATNYYVNLHAVRVDGKLLIDNNVTLPANVPSIASTVRANPTAGISIGKFTGTANIGTVSTGLSNTKLVFLKNRDNSSNWVVYHTLVDGSYDYMYLNLNNANASSSLSHAMTNTFKVGINTDTNASGDSYSFFSFSPVEGFSSFGTYQGNGSSDGPFIYTGFTPRWVMFKRTNSANNWYILDTARDSYNPLTNYLSANTPNAEATASNIADALSNGFKVRGGSNYYGFNGSGDSYVYVAFASSPFKYSRAR